MLGLAKLEDGKRPVCPECMEPMNWCGSQGDEGGWIPEHWWCGNTECPNTDTYDMDGNVNGQLR